MNQKTQINFKKGWIPNYHGAWAMIIIPVILGIIFSGFRPEHLLLLAFWWLGYFAFFAVSQWLHFRRKPDYFPAVKFYVLGLMPLGLALVLIAPYLIWWFFLYIPLMIVAFYSAIKRQERSLLNDTVAVFAAGLTLPVAFDLGTSGVKFSLIGDSGIFATGYLLSSEQQEIFLNSILLANWQTVWIVALFITAYFIGTVFYVKTNIRERKSNAYLLASFVFHAVFSVLAFKLASLNMLNFYHFALWVLLTIRSLAIPIYGRKVKWISAKNLGIIELVFSIFAFVTLIF